MTVQILIWLLELMQITLVICIPFKETCSLKIAHKLSQLLLIIGQALDLLVSVS